MWTYVIVGRVTSGPINKEVYIISDKLPHINSNIDAYDIQLNIVFNLNNGWWFVRLNYMSYTDVYVFHCICFVLL